MTYTPINWQTGDIITAEKLNKMDNGWAVESSSQQIFSEMVTTELNPEHPDEPAWGDFTYSAQITADTVTVTFDGTDYACTKVDSEGSNVYGGWGDEVADFTNYPFAIVSDPGENAICTATGGTHTVSVASTSSSIETSEQFRTAVESVVNTSTMPMECVSGTTTNSQMQKAFEDGRIMFFKPISGILAMYYVTSFTSENINFFPENHELTAAFDDGVFTVTQVM